MAMVITPVKYPTELQNQSNGDLDPGLLADIGFGTKMLATPAAWFKVMKAEFEKATGRVLNFTYGGGYRSWQSQYNLFISRYEKVSYATWLITPSNRRKTWNAEQGIRKPFNPTTSYWRKKVIGTLPNGQPRYPATAAVPGTSNHGWGLAIDLAIGVPASAVSLSASDRAWLEANVARFGFSYEDTSEPWHVRYVVGDVCPPFVNEPR